MDKQIVVYEFDGQQYTQDKRMNAAHMDIDEYYKYNVKGKKQDTKENDTL